ncbi:MAG TPA: 3-phosphoshikimate 1-carboxyvinyltransferase [Candidatus Eisenbacteria bacterium]|nr:3-phosphoshikimate 1-carboxyvinyltransferase [Candidatus Eisenbacteria bacterium]
MPPGASSRIVVHPGRGLGGSVTPPGDKSVTHRAYILGGLAEGVTTVEEPNPGADCESTLTCLEALGAEVRREPGKVTLRGCAMRFSKPDGILDCGNSGTTLRLLAGPLAAQPFRSTLAGDASLQRRPVDRVIEPLRRMGAKLSAREGDRLPPLEIEGGPLHAIEYKVESRSAQVASCVLLAGLFAEGKTTVIIEGARDHTQRMLPEFGAEIDAHELDDALVPPFSVTGPARLQGRRLRVPGDFSAAAFFLAGVAATPGAAITAEGVSLNPTRTGLLLALGEMGAKVTREQTGMEAGEPIGNVTVTGPDMLEALRDWTPASWAHFIPTMIDEIPALAVAAARARGVTRIRHAAELRVKESDRIAALATNLRRLGIEVEEHPDGLSIHGGTLRGGIVDAAGDHRIAMAFAVAGTFADGPVTVTGASEIATSYPGFVRALRTLGAEVEVPEEDALAR